MNFRPAHWLAPLLYSGRARIIAGVMLLFALMMAAVVADMLRRQQEFMEQQLAQQGAGLARTLAVSAPSWLLSNDVNGLTDLVGSLAATPNLHLAMILDTDGRVRASSDETLFNLVLDDEQSRRLLAAPPGSRQIWHDAMVDSMAEIAAGGRTIGHTRVILSALPVEAELQQITRSGGRYILIAIVLGGIVSWFVVRTLTRRLARLSDAADRIAAGQLEVEVPDDPGRDEVARLTRDFAQMALRVATAQRDLRQQIDAATAELRRRKEEAEAANAAKSRFLAAASHDLRQPMHALGLFTSRLSRMPLDHEARGVARYIETSVSALQDLLDTLLDISRIDAGLVVAKPATFLLNDLLARLQFDLAETAQRKGLRLRLRTGGNLSVHSDAVLLERILLNLLGNALRYTQRGGVLLACRRRGNRVRVEVWDTGIGIPAASQRAIFDEYVQLDNPERDRSKGLGLGLSICRRLAHLLDTSLQLRSNPGRGSVFCLDLPLAEMTEPAGEALLAMDLGRDSGGRLHGAVLIIDDDPLVLASTSGLVASWGCQTFAGPSVADAISECDRAGVRPDMAICDYRLRGLENGISSALTLRHRFGNNIPVLLISGDLSEDLQREAARNRLVLLSKPLKPARLRSLLQSLLAAEE
ncbi:ATP-binding protein [Sulfurisoma sediminicola]|uniref:histidine kinase n=1 Tax=Sulfurisoma sediminicola TaxID=1381557 RepID=A0A497XLV8_9PROT|nr:ATP-binding protein [Sulfurisoma sediminicola]RLJ68380.1 signal transduction histidine kinase [Sulfurisoma sediminicola]